MPHLRHDHVHFVSLRYILMDFFDFLEKWISRKLFFFPCGCFFRDRIRNRNGLRSIFQFWNRKLNFKTQSYFFVSFFIFSTLRKIRFRVKKRISSCRSRWTKLKTTDLEKSMRTDLGKKRFDCRSSKWLKHFAQKCKFGTIFFSTLDFIWKSHSFQFLVYALPNRFWQVLMKLKNPKRQNFGHFFRTFAFYGRAIDFNFSAVPSL